MEPELEIQWNLNGIRREGSEIYHGALNKKKLRFIVRNNWGNPPYTSCNVGKHITHIGLIRHV